MLYFSKADREWFKKNYEKYPLDEIAGNIVMAVSEPTMKAAMVFIYGVVPHGPSRQIEQLDVVSETATEATVRVNNYTEIPLVKEGPNWKIKGLFGAKAE